VGKKGVPVKTQTSMYLFNYLDDFDKIGLILKKIAHKCHFCKDILLLSMFKGNDCLTLWDTLQIIFLKYGKGN